MSQPVLRTRYGLTIAAVVVLGVGVGFAGCTVAIWLGAKAYRAVFGKC